MECCTVWYRSQVSFLIQGVQGNYICTATVGNFGNQYKFPIDNIGAMVVSKNINTTSGTKQVNVRTKYVNEYCEDGVIKIIFVESAENDADIFTKNLNQKLHSKYSSKLISAKKSSCLRHKFNIGRIWVKPPHKKVRSTVMQDIDLGYNIDCRGRVLKRVSQGTPF